MDEAGYAYEYAGENLAHGFDTSTGVVAGWMNSSSHRDNMLDGSYHDIGVAQANGVIEGQPTTVVVALYASPSDSKSQIALSEQSLRFALGTQTSYSLINPLPLRESLGWATRLSLPVLGAIGFSQLSQHIVLKRRKLAWDKH